ncbi:MAG: DUF3006 domain-containing protein [Methanotrichaceae archaeon]
MDRLEGNMAVLLIRDDESIKFNMPTALLPEGIQEGDILEISIIKDAQATEDAKARVSGRIERLKRKSQDRSGLI